MGLFDWGRKIWRVVQLAGDIQFLYTFFAATKAKVAAMITTILGSWWIVGKWVAPLIMGLLVWWIATYLEKKRIDKSPVKQVKPEDKPTVFFRDASIHKMAGNQCRLCVEVSIGPPYSPEGRVLENAKAELLWYPEGKYQEGKSYHLERWDSSPSQKGESAILPIASRREIPLTGLWEGAKEPTAYIADYYALNPDRVDNRDKIQGLIKGKYFFRVVLAFNNNTRRESPLYLLNIPGADKDNGDFWFRHANDSEQPMQLIKS